MYFICVHLRHLRTKKSANAFDTQNPQPGLWDPNAPHCNDTLTGGVPSFNGFPRRCPTPEGALAALPYHADDYFTLGVMNRFDLAPSDGSNCGQYRLVFARRDGPSTLVRHVFSRARSRGNRGKD